MTKEFFRPFIIALAATLPISSCQPTQHTINQTQTPPAPSRQPTAGSEEDRALRTSVPANFKNEPIRNALHTLANSAHLNLFIDEKALQQKLAQDATVTLDLDHDVPLEQALKMLAVSAGLKLEYFVENGVLTLTTEEGLGQFVSTKTYDVRQLLLSESQRLGRAEEDITRELIDLIVTDATPSEWTSAGGTTATIREVQGKLLVAGTPKTHRDVRALLAELEIGGRRSVPLHAGRPRAWESPEAAPGQAAADGMLAMSCELLQKLDPWEDNLVYSPLSLSTAFALANEAADGETRREIETAFHFPRDGDAGTQTQALINRIFPAPRNEPAEDKPPPNADSTKAVLNMTNRLYVSPQIELRQEFAARIKDLFQAGVKTIDFSRADDAAQTINRDIAKATRNLVPKLLAKDDIDPTWQAWVLVNTVYFKAAWATPFAKEDTRPATFLVSGQKPQKVKMMAMKNASMNYCEQPSYQAVCVPYNDSDFGLLVILPTDLDGLPAVEKQMTGPELQRLLARMVSRSVHLNMPRFAMRNRHTLIAPLQAQGVTSAFNPAAADFGRMAAKRTFINFVIQEAVLRVDEEGTEAAAATAVGGSLFGSPEPPPVPVIVRVDHPCLMMLLHLPTQTPVMVGRLIKPELAN